MINWTSSYIFDSDTDPDEGLNEDEVVNTFSKLNALYSQAKAGIGGGGKVNYSSPRDSTFNTSISVGLLLSAPRVQNHTQERCLHREDTWMPVKITSTPGS